MAMKNLAEYIRLTASKLKLDVKNIDNLQILGEASPLSFDENGHLKLPW
jgi:hypothetical protein